MAKHGKAEETKEDIELPLNWPNQHEIVDGVTPTDEVSQDPYLFADTTDALNETMGV